MPAPAVVGGLIAAGGTLLGSGANAYAQGKTNKKTRQWNEKMYGWQKKDNWENWNTQNQYNEGLWNKQNQYNEDLWHKMNQREEDVWNMQNSYNSPAAQMQRFKEAGLNPHLIYGQSNMGGSISTANFEHDPQRTASYDGQSPQGWNPKAPQFDLNEGLMAYNSFREQSARTNNLEAQNELIKKEAVLKDTQTVATLANTAKTAQETKQAGELFSFQVDAAAANIRRTEVETDIALSRNERESAANASNLREAAERILNMRGQRINAALDAKLKSMDIQLKQLGIQPTDNLFFRMLGRIFSEETRPANEWLNKGFFNLDK